MRDGEEGESFPYEEYWQEILLKSMISLKNENLTGGKGSITGREL